MCKPLRDMGGNIDFNSFAFAHETLAFPRKMFHSHAKCCISMQKYSEAVIKCKFAHNNILI